MHSHPISKPLRRTRTASPSESYSSPEARKVVYASMNPYELLRSANIFTWAVILIAALIIAVIVLITVKIVRKKKKRQAGKA